MSEWVIPFEELNITGSPLGSGRFGKVYRLVGDPWLRLQNRELKKTTTATATGTSLNKRFNEENNGSAREL